MRNPPARWNWCWHVSSLSSYSVYPPSVSETAISVLALIVGILGLIWPGGLPQMCSQIQGNRHRDLSGRELKSRVPICLAIRSESPGDAGLITDLSHSMVKFVEKSRLSSTVEVRLVPNDEVVQVVQVLEGAYRCCGRNGSTRRNRTGLSVRKIGKGFVNCTSLTKRDSTYLVC